jgi:hypothetical protein
MYSTRGFAGKATVCRLSLEFELGQLDRAVAVEQEPIGVLGQGLVAEPGQYRLNCPRPRPMVRTLLGGNRPVP